MFALVTKGDAGIGLYLMLTGLIYCLVPCFFFVILFYIFHVNQLSVKTKNSSVKNGPSMEGVVKTGNLWNKNVGKVVRNAVSLPVVDKYDV